MSDEDLLERIIDDETRRSFMKKGAVATVGAGLAASGTASAQDDGGGGLDEGWKALIFTNNFKPQAQFAIVSGVIEWTPNYGEIQDNYFSDYNTRMIRWQNTGEVDQLFVAQDANVGSFDENLGFVTDANDDQNQPQLFEMNKEWTPFGDDSDFITVNASPVGEEEEDSILENEDWWNAGDGGGGGGGGNGGG